MAFGDVRGTLSGNSANITNPFAATGSVAGVSVGDLVFSLLAQQTNLTVTACADNLGNTYSAQNAGTDAGSITGRAFWSYVTNAGTLTSVSATTTASANNVAFVAVVFEGPFDPSPLDANPANATDGSSPYTCPSTGTLSQPDELIVAWYASNLDTNFSATSPLTMRVQAVNSSNTRGGIGSQVVASTSAVAPAFTHGTNDTVILGTASFKAAASAGGGARLIGGKLVNRSLVIGGRLVNAPVFNAPRLRLPQRKLIVPRRAVSGWRLAA